MLRTVTLTEDLSNRHLTVLHENDYSVVYASWMDHSYILRFTRVDTTTGVETPLAIDAPAKIAVRSGYGVTVTAFPDTSAIVCIVGNLYMNVYTYDTANNIVRAVKCTFPSSTTSFGLDCPYERDMTICVPSAFEYVAYYKYKLSRTIFDKTGTPISTVRLSDRILLNTKYAGGFTIASHRNRGIIFVASMITRYQDLYVFDTNTVPVTCTRIEVAHDHPRIGRIALSSDGSHLAIQLASSEKIVDIHIYRVDYTSNVIKLVYLGQSLHRSAFMDKHELSRLSAQCCGPALTMSFASDNSCLRFLDANDISETAILATHKQERTSFALDHVDIFSYTLTNNGAIVGSVNQQGLAVLTHIRHGFNSRAALLVIVVHQYRRRTRLPAELWEWMADEFNM